MKGVSGEREKLVTLRVRQRPRRPERRFSFAPLLRSG
jgi:hypothetical protein